MKPQDDYRNGDVRGWFAGGGMSSAGSGGSRAGSASGSDDEGAEPGADELSLADAGAPARALSALNALRKSRQHFDCVLVADGAEVAAHRAVLAAASPYLLDALAAAPEPVALRVEGVDAEALRTLVEYAYTGRARVREAGAARRLYRAAWRLRVEPVRAHLAERLARRAQPHDAVELRALPDLEPHLLKDLDAYIANNFDEICEIGALAPLPKINIEMLRESSAEDGEETPVAVAAAALAWLRDRQGADVDLEELCSRTHLVFVDARGELRDCGELPASRDEAPELGEYRREAAERGRGPRRAKDGKEPRTPRPLELGARVPKAGGAGACCVIAARAGVAGSTRALVLLRGRLAAARVSWRAAGGGVARGGVLGGAHDAAPGERLAPLAFPRCAHGTAVADGRIVVAGGYDRARVLRATEAYDPATNSWAALADMPAGRARFPAARCGAVLYALGGSDGHADLDSVAALADGAWKKVARLPLARTHAAAGADEARGVLYVVGGWAGGLSLRRVDRYEPAAPPDAAWSEGPPLITGRSQCAGVLWADALWVLGGCDAWHCLASTETLRLDAPAAWTTGPALPTARRSVGGAVWRGRLVSVGGSDGAASLRRTDWLLPGAAEWRPGPDLRRARAALGVAVLDDVLYAVGGFDGKEFLSCVESLREPGAGWTALWAAPPLAALARRLSLAPQDSQREEVKENGTGEPTE